ncbi:MAG: helix-turn-helix transcriptional regulator [Gemmatimonadales bacterium]
MRERPWNLGFEPWFFWARQGARRRRRRHWFEAGDMKYVILKLLNDKPMHGYEVMKELEQHMRGCYKPSPGTIYPTLQWLEDEGLVRCDEVEGKKVYAITDEGRRFLAEHKSTVDEIFDRVDEMLDGFLSDPMPELTKRIGKLVTRAYKLSWKLRDDRVKQDEIVRILDQANDAIETLMAEV